MKILSAGDIHSDSTIVKRLVERATKENVDLVILCGDLTDAEKSTDNIIGPFLKAHKRVLLIPGNHESIATADFLAEVYDVKNLHGYSMQLYDPKNHKKKIGVFGCSSVNLGIHQITDKETYDLLKKGHGYVKDSAIRILVSHVHPSDTKMEKFTNFFEGSKGLRRAIDKFQPDIVFCSHVHEAEGLEEKIGKTRVINVGAKGKIIEI